MFYQNVLSSKFNRENATAQISVLHLERRPRPRRVEKGKRNKIEN